MSYLAKRKNETRERYLLISLLMVIPVVTLLGTLGRGLDWRLDYLGEFKVQGALLSAILFLWCLFKRFWEWALIFFLLALLNLALVSSRYHLIEKESVLPSNAHVFRLLYQDLENANKQGDYIQAVLDNSDADLVLWTNVPVDIYKDLNRIKGAYTLQNQTFDKNGQMMLALARIPTTARGAIPQHGGIWLSRVVGTRKLTVVLTSLGDPWSKQTYQNAQDKVSELSEFAKSRDEPVILVGGFNAAAWSSLLAPLELTGGLEPKGTVALTYPADMPTLMRRPTDHIYTHQGIEVTNLNLTPSIGTKHLGLIADIKIAPEVKEVEFYELSPVVPETDLLADPI